eukprot:2639630-Lingulodinium_polyedra.AAC.1
MPKSIALSLSTCRQGFKRPSSMNFLPAISLMATSRQRGASILLMSSLALPPRPSWPLCYTG